MSSRPRTFFEAFAALARAAGSWAAVPPLVCPDLGPLKFWPDMPWHQRADELEVDEIRTAMLAEVDVPVRCKTGLSAGNVRAGTPYQRVDGRPLHRVWPVRLLDGLGWRIPLPSIVARFGDPTGFLGDSQHVSIDVGRTTIHEVGALGVGWRGWQARNYRRSDYSRPFSESSSATAGGIPLLAGLARREEFAAGVIEHALLISGPASGRHRWPARGSDGQHPSHPLEYGDRLVLREDVAEELLAELDDPNSRAVVVCLRDYGAHLNDRTGLEIDASANIRLVMDRDVDVDVPGLRYTSFTIRRQPRPQEVTS